MLQLSSHYMEIRDNNGTSIFKQSAAGGGIGYEKETTLNLNTDEFPI